MDIKTLYNDYIEELNKQKQEKRYKDKEQWNQISSTGRCFLNVLYKKSPIKPAKFDKRVNRILQLGNIVHKDIQNSVDLIIEEEVYNDKLNIRGYIDIVDPFNNTIYDIKTVGAYSWRKKVKKNADEEDRLSKMQISMYGYCYRKMFGFKSVNKYLIYYNKDNSNIKTVEVEDKWEELGIEYWEDYNEFEKIYNSPDKYLDGIRRDTPFEEWECNYCQYFLDCDTPYLSKRKQKIKDKYYESNSDKKGNNINNKKQEKNL